VYRPQPKRRRTDPSLNPLWARYMQPPDGAVTSTPPYLCRAAHSNAVSLVSAPVSSLSSAVDRTKINGQSVTKCVRISFLYCILRSF